MKNNWLIFANDDILSNKLAKKILMIAEESIKLKGDFTIVLAGGKSPKKLYEILKGSNSEWDKWIVYIGDERCLPIDDNERNDGQIMKEWLNVSHIKKENIYSIKAELGMLNAKLDYEKVLSKVDVFDVVLLSVGEDGHTASLFPNRRYNDIDSVVLEYKSPKKPLERISMSYSRLNSSKYVFKIVSGRNKKDMVDSWIEGKLLPINKINGNIEEVYLNINAISRRWNNTHE